MMRQGYRQLLRAMRMAGAQCAEQYRMQRDANGAPLSPMQKIGCLYGLRYERGQTANLLVDIPGVVARVDAPRLLCVLLPSERPDVQTGDMLRHDGRWYEAVASQLQMGYVLDVVMKESVEPDGIST